MEDVNDPGGLALDAVVFGATGENGDGEKPGGERAAERYQAASGDKGEGRKKSQRPRRRRRGRSEEWIGGDAGVQLE